MESIIDVNIARSEDEAERQARGENVLAKTDDIDEADEQTEESAEFFDAATQEAIEQSDDETET